MVESYPFLHSKNIPMNQTKTQFTQILACGLALVALPCAFADQSGKHSPEAMFKMMDTDGDGLVSRTEHAAHGKQMFIDADSNHDGMVTLTEMTAACAKMNGDMPDKDELSAAEMIKMHDTNMDGQLSAAEQTAGCDDMFAKMDTNGDGQLSQAEFKAGRKMMKMSRKSST